MGVNWIFTKLVLTGMILGILVLFAGATQMKYEVTICQGMVAVRQTQTAEIFFTATPAHALPPEDRSLLAKGILCKNEGELYQILENFCS